MTVRLALRLLRGGGRSGMWRLSLLLVGIALGMTALLYGLAVPVSSSASADKAAQRLPRPAADRSAAPQFRYALSEGSDRGRVWVHVVLADVKPGASPPPGVQRMPEEGEVIASPAAARAIVRDGGRVLLSQLRVGPAGLRDPDELVDYTRVRGDDLPGGGAAGAGFGVPVGKATAGAVPAQTLFVEMLLLVGVPAAVYLSTVTQLSAATRARRLAALRLVGASERLVARASAVESALAGAGGALLGLTLYQATAPVLADSGLLGFRWFPSDTRFGPGACTALAVGITVGCAWLGALSTRRRSRTLLAVRAEPDADPGSVWRLLPLAVGLALLLPTVVLSVAVGPRKASGAATAMLVAGAALSVVGLVTSIRPLTAFVARRLATGRSLAVRLAARRLLFEPSSAIRVTTGLVVLVVIAGLGSALLHDAELAAGPAGTTRLASIDTASITSLVRRNQAFALPALGRAAFVPVTSDSTAGDATGLTVAYASCADFATLIAQRAAGCRDGVVYQLRDPAEVSGPPTVAIGRAVALAGSGTRVRAERTLAVPGLFYAPIPTNSILVAGETPPPGGWPASTEFLLRISARDDAAAALQERLRALSPAATLTLQDENLAALEGYRLHRGVIHLGVGLGFLLGILAFLISSADRAMERQAHIAALLAVGVPVRMLLTAQVVQLLVPLVAILGAAAAVAVLAGAAYLAAGGLVTGVYVGGAGPALLLVAASAILGALSAPLLSPSHPRVEHLRRA